jgi:hypothetical protein
MNEICERRGIKPETLLCDHGDEAGAGLECRIIEFAVALFLLEVRGVGSRQKRALVMIEPPSNFGRTGILEINNGILVAIELSLVEQCARAVQQSGEDEVGIASNAFPVKTGKQRRGRGSIEAFVVVENLDPQSIFQFRQLVSNTRTAGIS